MSLFPKTKQKQNIWAYFLKTKTKTKHMSLFPKNKNKTYEPIS